MTITQRKTKPAAAGGKMDVLDIREPRRLLSYHFVGIGGCGMSALAQMLHQQGHRVSGSDLASCSTTDKLSQLGITVHIGHDPAAMPEAIDCLVVSAAIKPDNCEWVQAEKQNVKVLKYAQLLGLQSVQIPTLAIAGTHGKSTTSGWLTYALSRVDRTPSFVVGAEITQLGSSSGLGRSDLLVVEACEYDRSFLNLHPQSSAILNIEPDHLDYYRDLQDIIDAFGQFALRVTDKGVLIANGSDVNVRKALDGKKLRIEYFSARDDADWTSRELGFEKGHGCFDLCYRGESFGRVKLALAGRHNVENALAVAAMAHHAGLSAGQICAGLESFEGVQRRMSCIAIVDEVTILDDYAHHPTEIRVTLEAIRQKYQPGRLWCVFQPHQQSRTRFLLDDFATSFDLADIVLLPEIYFVRDSEQSHCRINAKTLAERINQQGGNCSYLGEFDRIVDHLDKNLHPGDLVVTMGAGNIWNVADALVRRLTTHL